MNTAAVFHPHPGERPHAKVDHYDGTHAIIVFFDHTDAGSLPTPRTVAARRPGRLRRAAHRAVADRPRRLAGGDPRQARP